LDADGAGVRLLLCTHVGITASTSVPVSQLVTGARVTVGVDEPIERVYALMVRDGQRFVAVCQGGRVTAVLDREHLARRLIAAGLRHRQLFVRDVLHPGMACLPASAPLGAAAKLMRATGSSAVPVLDESHHLVGLVTAKDVADALSDV
jgi:CBS domain-containing protein